MNKAAVFLVFTLTFVFSPVSILAGGEKNAQSNESEEQSASIEPTLIQKAVKEYLEFVLDRFAENTRKLSELKIQVSPFLRATLELGPLACASVTAFGVFVGHRYCMPTVFNFEADR